ncbi:hypothetical protein [Kordiimonas sp. SCSIO 12610]|uniref:hypothetical protein n=1 Tax=Kordiimonas sp. SCSIO 12610 TaxID=2829597 RepID=UPI00210AAB73|nr:hypothetical protein [Kordiimonas sp. SCSIO 12610]UTW55059.1 hypothetical protein KFF44_14815 [Kordiimonas sp. SCSIO 12610]
MQKLTIHMGVHRAGSTSLQSFLRAHSTDLEEENIKLLTRPDLKGTGFKGYLTKVKNTSPNSLIRMYLEKHLKSEFQKIEQDHILISEENLIGAMPVMRSASDLAYPKLDQFLYTLFNWRHEFDIHPRLIVRRQDKWVESLYAFQVFRGLGARFSEFTNSFSRKQLDWSFFLNALEQRGLLPHTLIMPLEACGGQDHSEWVPNFLGIDDGTLSNHRVETNERMLLRDLKLFWALNKIGWAKGKRGKRRNLRRKLVQMSHIHGDRELDRAEVGDYLLEAGVKVSNQNLKHVESAYLGMEYPYFSDVERQEFLAPYQNANKSFLNRPEVLGASDLWDI